MPFYGINANKSMYISRTNETAISFEMKAIKATPAYKTPYITLIIEPSICMYGIVKMLRNNSVAVTILPNDILFPSFLSSSIVGKIANIETKLEKISYTSI